MRLSPDELGHAACVDEIAAHLGPTLEYCDPVLRSAVLATLLAQFLADYPPRLRNLILAEHLAVMGGLVQLYDLQAGGQQAN